MGQVTCIIPCGGAKLDHAAPARDLYIGQMFRHSLTAAFAAAADEDGRVLILSAMHGLIDLDTVIDPYDVRMGRPGSVTPDTIARQAEDLGIEWGDDVMSFLPATYYDRLSVALQSIDVYPMDVYEATAGIGDQRHVNSIVTA